MTKKKNTIKVSDIDRMINEEIQKMKKADKIRARLAVVNEELKRLGMDEVEVGGVRNGEAYYEKGVPVAKFQMKGTHMKEDDMLGDDGIEATDDLGMGEELPMEADAETFESKLAAIGRELDAKISGIAPTDDVAMDGDVDGEIELDGDIDVDAADAPDAEPESDEVEIGGEDSDEDGEAEDEIEIDETGGTPDEAPKEEAKEEVKEESEMMNESVSKKSGNPLVAKERARMKKLAGL